MLTMHVLQKLKNLNFCAESATYLILHIKTILISSVHLHNQITRFNVSLKQKCYLMLELELQSGHLYL